MVSRLLGQGRGPWRAECHFLPARRQLWSGGNFRSRSYVGTKGRNLREINVLIGDGIGSTFGADTHRSPQAGHDEQAISCGRCFDRPIRHAQAPDSRRPPVQTAPHEPDRRRLAGEFMAHRSAGRANPPEADMRDPEAEQIRASDDTPGTTPVPGGIVACNSMRISLMDSDPTFIARSRVNHTGLVRQSLEIVVAVPDFARARIAVEEVPSTAR